MQGLDVDESLRRENMQKFNAFVFPRRGEEPHDHSSDENCTGHVKRDQREEDPCFGVGKLEFLASHISDRLKKSENFSSAQKATEHHKYFLS